MKLVYHLVDEKAIPLFVTLSRELLLYDMQIIFVTESTNIELALKSNGCAVVSLKSLYESYFNEAKQKRYSAVEEIINRYGVSANDVAMPDPLFCNYSITRKANVVASYLSAWEQCLNEIHPTLALGTDGCEVPNLTYSIVADYLGLKSIYTNGCSVLHDHMYWDRSIMLGTWVNRDFLLDELTKEEEDIAKSLIQCATTKKSVIGWTTQNERNLSYRRFCRAISYYKKCILGSSRYHRLTWSLSNVAAAFLRQKITPLFYRSTPLAGFAYMPLHVPNDAQIRLRTPAFIEQYKAVILCSRSLPPGYVLCVKEHPHAPGAVPLKWLRIISSLPNVALVQREINSHDLISNADMVITINSDVGWEALFHCKPVVTLAKPFYSNLGLTYDVNCFNYNGVVAQFEPESEKRLKTQVEKAITQKSVSPEDVVRLVSAVLRSLYNCTFYQNDGSFSTCKENISKIALSIKNEYKKLVGY